MIATSAPAGGMPPGPDVLPELAPPELAPAAYRGGMRLLASGVCLITTALDGARGGLIATAVTSVSAEPPTLLVCVNRSASAYGLMDRAGVFCVNVLAQDAEDLVQQFSTPALREARFGSGGWTSLQTGAPVCDRALVAFDCRIAQKIDWQSHTIFLGAVRAVVTPRPAAPPLLYMDGQLRKLAAPDHDPLP